MLIKIILMLLGIEEMEPGETGSPFSYLLTAVLSQRAALQFHNLGKSRRAPPTAANKTSPR